MFAGDTTVEVIFDRRRGERRRCVVPVQDERRNHDRRTQDISYELERLGYALIRREDGPHLVSNPDGSEQTLREPLDSEGGLD